MKENYKEICEYSCLEDVNIRRNPITEYVRDGLKYCKFCGRPESSDLHFRKRAHVISASAGNRTLKTLDECDECNEETGVIFESDFAKYIQPLKIVSNVYGRDNTIKYIDTPNHHKIIRKKNGYVHDRLKVKTIIIDTGGQNSMVSSFNDNEGKTKLRRQVYNPYNVYLALLKMALSMMPKSEMDNFKSSLLRIKAICVVEMKFRKEKLVVDEEKDQIDYIRKSFPNAGMLEFLPGENPFCGTSAKIYKRLDEYKNNPLYVFQLMFGNYAIYIPVCTDYELDNQKDMKLSICKTKSYSELKGIDFTKVEDEFYCDYITSGKIEVPKEILPEIGDYLREKGLLMMKMTVSGLEEN